MPNAPSHPSGNASFIHSIFIDCTTCLQAISHGQARHMHAGIAFGVNKQICIMGDPGNKTQQIWVSDYIRTQPLAAVTRTQYRMHFELVVFIGEEFLDVFCKCIWLLHGCKVAARRELGPLLQVVLGGSPGLGRAEELLGEVCHSCGHLQGNCQEVSLLQDVSSVERKYALAVSSSFAARHKALPVSKEESILPFPCTADNTWPCSMECLHACRNTSITPRPS